MKHKFIPNAGPFITQKEVEYVARAAKDGWNKNSTKYVNLFEKKFASYVNRKYSLATSSGTGALHLSYLSLNLRAGDEVLAPNITWIASVEPLYWMGIKVIFVDIDPETWCIDPVDIKRKITKKTKAILIVDLYGNMPNIKDINKIAKKHNLKIIEDAAQAAGCEYFGKKAGSFGDVSCFSFHGSKTLTTGEGGMILTDNKKIFEKAKYYNDHCKNPKRDFWNLEIGYKYKMSNFQAACGIAQLERINELLRNKRKIFFWYKRRLSKIDGLKLNSEPKNTKNNYWMVTIVFDKKYKINKEKIIGQLNKFNIQGRPFFYPLSILPAIKTKAFTPNAFDISSRAINLPSNQRIKEDDVSYVCNSLFKIFKIKR